MSAWFDYAVVTAQGAKWLECSARTYLDIFTNSLKKGIYQCDIRAY